MSADSDLPPALQALQQWAASERLSGVTRVDQARIDAFADATGDHNWIHVDPARAQAQMPGGRTIAHGFLLLSLTVEDDVAALAMGADMRQHAAHAVHHAHQVDVEHPAPGIRRDVVDAAAAGDAGVVAQHVDPAESGDRRLRRAIDAVRIGDIACHAAYVADTAQALDRTRQRLGLDIGEHHLHARLRKGSPERETDTAGAARHNGCLAGEVLHDFPPMILLVADASSHNRVSQNRR